VQRGAYVEGDDEVGAECVEGVGRRKTVGLGTPEKTPERISFIVIRGDRGLPAVNLETLVPLAWALWGILLVIWLVVAVMLAREAEPTPDMGPGCSTFVLVLVSLLVLGAGGLLYLFTWSQSFFGVLVMAVVLGLTLFLLIAQPVVRSYDKWSFERDYARAGKFKEPALRRLVEAIRSGDGATLTRLLDGKPPPPGRDRAGNDLWGYALVDLRRGKGSLDCIRALLQAGSDPDSARLPDGLTPIHFMIVDITPRGREAVQLLLQHGADPNLVDPTTGNTPILETGDSPDLVRALVGAGADLDRIQSDGVTALVRFVGEFRWESAQYLVEQGARLDAVSENGRSLEYYLDDWKDSVFGEHPEGWDRLRAAIAARGRRT